MYLISFNYTVIKVLKSMADIRIMLMLLLLNLGLLLLWE